MATLFEGWLVGNNLPYLRATANLLQSEIVRIEQLLSRFDPTAELARINREAPARTVRAERELVMVLQDCLQWYDKTEGYFDIGTNTYAEQSQLNQVLKVYPASSEVSFRDTSLSLDLGGYGKGYALDKLAHILADYGINNYFLHGGMSSILAKGKQAKGEDWQIRVGEELKKLEGGFSWSGHTGHEAFDCAIFSPVALTAEVYSTALIAMGRQKAANFASKLPAQIHVQFIQSQIA